MALLQEVEVPIRSLDQFAPIIGEQRMLEIQVTRQSAHESLSGRRLWNVNTTAVGGGVAEMLQSLVGYAVGAGVDCRWVVIRGNSEFFRITKRLHHALHGSPGDGTPLDAEARAVYEQTLKENAEELCARVQPDDIVLLHDPQTAGLAPALRAVGANLIWRCHIGSDETCEEVERAWAFLGPYLAQIPAYVFSRKAYVPDCCDHGKSHIIRPSIDAFSVKNQEMDEETVRAILMRTGLIDATMPIDPDSTRFRRLDGSLGRVERAAEIVRSKQAPSWGTPLVVQVSRWDPLKDMLGVMQGFEALIASDATLPAELVLAGPNVNAVTDDPEGAEVFDSVLEAWEALPPAIAKRIHLVNLPTDDVDENAAIVNALQRHAAVIVQKSLREGFGLTVTEAMWKGRPIIATAVGGIQDQITDGVHGLLLKDPRDRSAFASALRKLLVDEKLATKLGNAAKERVRQEFLGSRHLLEYAKLLEDLGY